MKSIARREFFRTGGTGAGLVFTRPSVSEAARDRGKAREWRARMAEQLAERGAPFVVKGDLAPRPERMLYSPHYPGAAKG